jgi:GMP synthase (glutamine-hydrolysing)
MYEGKASAFDAFTSHYDEVTHVQPGGLILSGNAFTTTQSVAVRYLNVHINIVELKPLRICIG